MKLKALFISSLLGLFCSVWAVPAPERPVKVTQPDGSVLTIIVHGDEYLSWITTIDGYSIQKNADGYFEYIKRFRQGKAVLSGIRATEPEQRTDRDNIWLNRQPKNLKGEARDMEMQDLPKRLPQKQSKGQMANGIFWQIWSFGFASLPDFKGILVPVSFADYAFETPLETIDSMMNCPDYGNGFLIGSVHDYYHDMSQGKFDFNIKVLPVFTVSGNRTSYGTFARDIKYEVLDYVKQTLTEEELAEYDRNGDGEVDHISILFAGHGQEFTGEDGMIWSHNTVVEATSFSCIAEIDNFDNLPGIETYCHEFGHVLGLADHYDTDYGANGAADHPGVHDLMSSNTGQGNPVPLSAFSRFALGWNTLKTITADEAGRYHLTDRLTSAYSLCINTQTPGEFFVVENRGTTDKWQRHPYLGHGLLIFRVDTKQYISNKDYNQVNADSAHLGYALMRADNSSLYNLEDIAKDYFPHGTDFTAFTDETVPSARSLSGKPTGLPLTDIAEVNDTVSFTFVSDASDNNRLIAVTGVTRSLDTGWRFSIDAEIMVLGNAVCQEKGICFGLSSKPSINDQKAVAETEGLSYTITFDFSELYKSGATVYLRAYATDADGETVYGSSRTIETYMSYHNVIINRAAHGQIDVQCAGKTISSPSRLRDGSELTLTARPNAKYRFERWMDGDTTNPRLLVLNRDTSISASFTLMTDNEETAPHELIAVYPNPVEDRLHIDSPVMIHTAVLTDMKGKLLQRLSDFRQAELSLKDWPAGNYLLICRTEAGEKTIKIVKL